jgi:hypothetical protein
MTAAPDPRFRDQLAEDEVPLIGEAWLAVADRGSLVAECRRLSELAQFNLKRAQTAEAEVQAATNQRAAEELRKAADWIWDETPALATASAELHARADALDDPALAQPARDEP